MFLKEDFKLSFEDVVFHVSKSNKTGKTVVTCEMTGCFRQLGIEFSAVGKAVCSANDVDIVNIGKAVAQAKAESKCYVKASKYLRNMTDEGCALLIAATDRFEEKAEGVIAHNEEYINRVTDPTSELYKKKVSK